MNRLNNNYLKLAVQKNGRLTNDTFSFLRKCGLEFDSYRKRLFSLCRNFPLEILFVRDDDIGDYVASGTVDLGIVGQNILYEERPKVRKLLNLRYGFCSLVVAVPKESDSRKLRDFQGKKIATTYPKSAKAFFAKNNISVKIISIGGSVEITPALGIADGIVDLTSTGSTFALNDLKIVTKIYDSEAVLIVNKQSFVCRRSRKLIDKLSIRFQGVLSAKKYKYVMMSASEKILPKLKKNIPGLKSPTILPLAEEGLVSIQSVVNEDVFLETIDRLKRIGATGIIVLPIDKMIA